MKQNSTKGSVTKGKVEGRELKSLIFELHGSQFENRPVDRATKKFKQHRMDHL